MLTAMFRGNKTRFSWTLIILGAGTVLLTSLASPNSHAQEAGFSTEIKGSVGGNSGQFVTSIPIQVPSGRRGFSPQLALAYSSAEGNGFLGVGWDVPIDYIARNTKHGVDYACDPSSSPEPCYVAVVGGASIQLIPRTDWCADCYGAKIEGGFTRFRFVDAAYWEATDKTGTRYLFGQTAASQQDGTPGVFKWMLDTAVDTHSNTIAYTYFKDQGAIYLDRIEYQAHQVVFRRDDGSRPDKPVLYGPNFPLTVAYRLKTIEVWSGGSRIRAYKLTYNPDEATTRSVLQSVQQFGKNVTIDASGTVTGGSAMPTVDLTWHIPPHALQSDGEFGLAMGVPVTDKYQSWADVDGNGEQEFLYLKTGASGNKEIGVNDWFDYFASLDFSPIDAANCFWADVTGDGKQDFIYRPSANPSQLRVIVSDGSFGGADQPWGTLTYSTIANFVFDVDRDGKADWVYVEPNYTIRIKLSTGSGFSSELSGDAALVSAAKFFSIQLADVDGDGDLDLVSDAVIATQNRLIGGGQYACAMKYSLAVNLNTGGQFAAHQIWLDGYYTASWLAELGCDYQGLSGSHNLYLADGNGDGKADMLLPPIGSSPYTLRFSTGSALTSPVSFSLDATPTDDWLWVTDANADGMADILYNRSGTRELWVRLGTGSGFPSETRWGTRDAEATTGNYRWLGDVDADGKPDLVYKRSGSNKLSALSSEVPMALLLKTVATGMGSFTQVDYVPASWFTISGSGWNLPPGIPVVQQITVCDKVNGLGCVGNSAATTYSYSGGFFNPRAREFRGFAKIEVTTPSWGGTILTETFYHQGNDTSAVADDPQDLPGYMQGRPYLTRVSSSSLGVVSRTEFTYWDDVDGVAPYFTPLKQQDSFTCDESPCKQVQTITYYDDRVSGGYSGVYGNVTQEEHKGEISIATDDKTVTRQYSPPPPSATSSWIVGLPITETTFQGLSTNAIDQVQKTDFYYDQVTDCATASTLRTPTKGDVTRVVGWHREGTDRETRMAYDSYGNLACARDANGNTTSTTYDSTGVAPRVVTNALGQQTTTEYYGLDGVPDDTALTQYGLVKQVTDANGVVISQTEYDEFGRKVKTTTPDGSVTRVQYNNFGTVDSQHVKTTVADGTGLALSTWAYFDGLGRTVLQKKTGPDGKVVATQTEYHSAGVVSRTSLPYFEGLQTPIWRSPQYDSMNRLRQMSNPDGTRTLTCYGNWVVVTIDEENHRKRVTRDAYGRVVKTEEYTGTYTTCTPDALTPYATTTKEYDVLGNLRFVTDTKGNRIEMRYDSLGRKIFLHDPDLGEWTYEYYPNGNLWKQTDGKGQEIEFTYDALNRVRTKTVHVGIPAPTALSAVDTPNDQGGSITLNWTPSTSSGITQQRLYRSPTAGGTHELVATFSNNTTNNYTDSGLTTGSTYYYAVRAYDGVRESAYSNQAGATALDNLPPIISTVTAGSVTSIGATITWTTDEAGDSQVEYGTSTLYGSVTQLDPALVTSHTMTLTELAPSSIYHYRVLSKDSAGNVATSEDFTFTTSPLAGWTYQTVDTGNGAVVGHQSSIIMDSFERPHIAYYDFTNGDLKHARRTESGWVVEVADTANDVGQFPSLKLDSLGNPHISYFDNAYYQLKYAKWTGTEWLTEILNRSAPFGGTFGGQYNSLALDSTNKPNISFYGYDTDSLWYAQIGSSGWEYQPVDWDGDPSLGGIGQWTSLKLDTAGDPYISYQDPTWTRLKLAHRIGSTWLTEVVDDSQSASSRGSTSLALGADGYPQIFYSASRYARKTDTGWTFEAVDAGETDSSSGSMALAPNGDPVVVYVDQSLRLTVARRNGAGWEKTIIDAVGSYATLPSIAIDSGGAIHLSYYDAVAGDLVYATEADATAPLISGVAAGNLTASNATITWTTDEAADTQVEYGTTTSYGSSTTLDPTLAASHSATLSGLAASTLYHYQVKSRDAAGNLATSGDFTFTTAAAPPQTPWQSNAVGTPTTNLAYCYAMGYHFTPQVNGQVTGLGGFFNGTKTVRLFNKGTGSLLASTTVTAANTWSYTSVTPVTVSAGTTYTVAIYLACSGGSQLGVSPAFPRTFGDIRIEGSTYVDTNNTPEARPTSTVTTVMYGQADIMFSSTGGDTTPPAISSVTAGSITANGATITWTTDEAADSQVEYGTTTSYGSSTTLDTTLVTSHSATVSGLAASTLYHYRVKSRDAAGNLATSGDFTFTTAADTTPPVISGVTAGSVAAGGATITWTTDEAADSQVEYGTTTSYGSSTTLDTTLVTSHSATVSGLAASTLYHYRVKSRDAAGNLATSGDFTFTTTAGGGTQTPWQSNAVGTPTTNQAYCYAMGYHFTPQVDGQVTGLGGFFNGTKTVRLFNKGTGALLASTTVTAANTWAYTSITPVSVSAGTTYTVAVYLACSGGSELGVSPAFPRTFGDIRIEGSTYVDTNNTPDARPTNTVTGVMYGQADIMFAP